MFVDNCTRAWEAGGVCGLQGDQLCTGSLIHPVSGQRLIPECVVTLGILLQLGLSTMYAKHLCDGSIIFKCHLFLKKSEYNKVKYISVFLSVKLNFI